jgi:hypothetical protein
MVTCPVSVLSPMKSLNYGLFPSYRYISQDHSHLQTHVFQNKLLVCNYLHYGRTKVAIKLMDATYFNNSLENMLMQIPLN